MGDIADYITDQFDMDDPDGMDELRICPVCGYGDCHVNAYYEANCPKCGFNEQRRNKGADNGKD